MRTLSQLGIQKEGTPGTLMTGFDSTHVKVEIGEGDGPAPAVGTFDPQRVQGSSSSRPIAITRHDLPGQASYLLKESGTPASAAPAFDLLWEAAMLKRFAVKQVAVGSITGGPYVDGETITQGAATARVFRDAAATPLKFSPITGTITQGGGAIVGGTSGASSTPSAEPVNKGFFYRIVDSDFIGVGDSKHHLSMEWLRGGYFWRGRGCLGELSIEFRNGQPAMCRQSFLGAWAEDGDKALYSISTYPDQAVVPPRFVDAELFLGAYKPTDIVDFNLTIPLSLELREDANDESVQGIRFADYKRKGSPPIVTFDPAMVLKATKDFFGELKAGSTFALKWMLGTKIEFFADEAQYVEVGTGERGNIATAPIQLRLNGTDGDELYIWIHD